MQDIVRRYICDACFKEECVNEGAVKEDWVKTEIGDLCPVCARAWDNYKKSFVEKMRKDNGESLI